MLTRVRVLAKVTSHLHHSIATYIRVKERKKKCRVGLDFVHWKLIGWLWFSIGGSHMSDIVREEMTYRSFCKIKR